jgi:hypothetical protein
MPSAHAVVLALAVVAVAPARQVEPVVSVWYRGTPAGTPRLDDLAAIRAVGFTGVTWPSKNPAGLPELSRLARLAGLTVVAQPEGSAVEVDGRLNVPVQTVGARGVTAHVWRAVARGVRVISFDPGQSEGTGLGAPGRALPAWVAPAVALSRQLSANAPLFGELRLGPSPAFLGDRPPMLEVVLLEGARCWVVVATNAGRARTRGVVELPRGIPYAIWVSLIDGSTIAMRDRPTGAQWTLDLEPGDAGVYVIDKPTS